MNAADSAAKTPRAQISVLSSSVVFDNPSSSTSSRHGFFPGIERLPSGELVALLSVGEAFESNDHLIHVARSADNGITWKQQGQLHADARPGLGSMKPVLLDDDSLLAIGYAFYREDSEALVNAKTGGLVGGADLTATSQDGGQCWSMPQKMDLSRPELLEISGPAIQSISGDVLALGTPLVRWDGTRPSDHVGVLLRSRDRGRTWDDRTRYFDHPTITPLEARLTQMQDGRLVAIVWAFDESAGMGFNNHIAVSHDDGKSWSPPVDIGIAAQASNILALRDNKLLSIHAHRESLPAGIVIRLVNLTEDRWRTIAEQELFRVESARTITSFADMGENIKFGQPALLALGDGESNEEFLAYYWSLQGGQGRVIAHRIQLSLVAK